ncbi:MAG: LysR family transcriptional regulator [Pyramidobacter sp.]|nr:LysR family transcriptional regulator [Pyramidobacter sp.]
MVDSRLYSLLKVAEFGNYTRAAEQLSLTQPAVSQHIRSLEGEFKIKIFERVSNKLHITHEGETVLKYAKRILALVSNLRRELNNEKLQLCSLTIGITHTAESNAIAEALAKYANSRGGISLKIITDVAANLYDKLKNYEIDLAVVEGSTNDPDLVYLMLDSDCLVLAVAPEHPLTRKNVVTINDLKKERLILRLPDSGTRNLFVSSLESQNMSISDFNVMMEINNIATIKDLIRRNLGVSVLARSTCLDELKKKKIAALPIEHFSMAREINIVYLRDFEHKSILKDIVRSYSEVKGKIESA